MNTNDIIRGLAKDNPKERFWTVEVIGGGEKYSLVTSGDNSKEVKERIQETFRKLTVISVEEIKK